jgi:DUF4097 and DUF4098 domain-containing protein YvlB
MMLLTVYAGLVMLSATQQADTIVPIRPDGRLEVKNFAGEIVINSWERNAVRIRATHSRRERIRVRGSDASVSVEAYTERGPTLTVDYEITVPSTLSLDLGGTYTDITVGDARGDVAAATVRGDVRVRGGTGIISATSVEGIVTIEGARGRISANGTNKGIRIIDASGQIAAETVNGDVQLEGIESHDVEAVTVNGDITYDGEIRDRGRYFFATHNGRVSVSIPEDANATVSVNTYTGQFSASFPIRVTDQRNSRRFTFTLGSGSAKVEAQSFQGAIRLRRPGMAASKEER